METLNPSVVGITESKVGLRALLSAELLIVLLPSRYPVLLVVCVTVAVAPADKPDTCRTLVEPLEEITTTEPIETVGVAQL